MLISQRPTLSEDSVVDTRSRFVIEPLEPGFGYTLGNSLRRTLLSSIPGAAVTSIRIDGVLHEFTTVPGVKEDVTDIILNLKELVLRSESDEPVTVYLKAKGPGAVTAADIAPPAGVEILNPDLHIATLGKGGSLEMELTVERGVGYRMADKNKKPRDPIGVIPVDSIFSPVRRVSYSVENTRVEQMTDRDRLILDVETDGSVAPREAGDRADVEGLLVDAVAERRRHQIATIRVGADRHRLKLAVGAGADEAGQRLALGDQVAGRGAAAAAQTRPVHPQRMLEALEGYALVLPQAGDVDRRESPEARAQGRGPDRGVLRVGRFRVPRRRP